MYSKYLINCNSTILDALKKLNGLGKNEAFALFVVDDNNIVLGSLTDGDIRRSLIEGKNLETKIGNIAYKMFSYINENESDIKQIHTDSRKYQSL